ncbi:MAG: NGG1p interacting factor NIF3 [Candidatus Comchoanobacterales bacterium]
MRILLVVYIPEHAFKSVTEALFNAGAGQVGGYRHCGWSVLGKGQFIPEPSAKPYLGEPGKASQVPEMRFECPVDMHSIQAVLGALKDAHPYEEPVYYVLKDQINEI